MSQCIILQSLTVITYLKAVKSICVLSNKCEKYSASCDESEALIFWLVWTVEVLGLPMRSTPPPPTSNLIIVRPHQKLNSLVSRKNRQQTNYYSESRKRKQKSVREILRNLWFNFITSFLQTLIIPLFWKLFSFSCLSFFFVSSSSGW